MANPTILFDNIYENRLGSTTLTATSEASGFPIENIDDWRLSTAYRWKATSAANQNIDLTHAAPGGSHRNGDTLVIAGHNLESAGCDQVEIFGDDTTIGTTSLATHVPADDTPFMVQFTDPGDMRYWRIALTSSAWSAAPQIGIICVGTRMDFEAGALQDLDPYGIAVDARGHINNNGVPVGVDVRSTNKRFQLSYNAQDGGMTRDTFFAPSSGISFDDDFIPHAIKSAKPFFFNWNFDVDPTEVYLCTVENYSVSMPFIGSTKYRGLNATLLAHSEAT